MVLEIATAYLSSGSSWPAETSPSHETFHSTAPGRNIARDFISDPPAPLPLRRSRSCGRLWTRDDLAKVVREGAGLNGLRTDESGGANGDEGEEGDGKG